jgi:hypothetical protein
VPGDAWWKSDNAQAYLYYDDGSSAQWVSFIGAMGPAGAGVGGITAIAGVVSGTTITWASIPQTGTTLEIVASMRDTAAATFTSLYMQANGNTTAANYPNSYYQGGRGTGGLNGAATASTANGGVCGELTGVSGNASATAIVKITIPAYTGTAFPKVARGESSMFLAASFGTVDTFNWSWCFTPLGAITSLVLTTSGSGFAAGTQATLFVR